MNFTPVYGTLNENQLRIYVLRAQQNQEGDSDLFHLLSWYTSFWLKHDIAFQTCQTKLYRGFSASLRHIERKSAIEGITKPSGGYRYNIYYHGKPLSGKTYDTAFYFDLIFNDGTCFPVVAKNPEEHIHPLSRVIHSRTTYMTTYVRIIARNSQQTTQSARDRTQNTRDRLKQRAATKLSLIHI